MREPTAGFEPATSYSDHLLRWGASFGTSHLFQALYRTELCRHGIASPRMFPGEAWRASMRVRAPERSSRRAVTPRRRRGGPRAPWCSWRRGGSSDRARADVGGELGAREVRGVRGHPFSLLHVLVPSLEVEGRFPKGFGQMRCTCPLLSMGLKKCQEGLAGYPIASMKWYSGFSPGTARMASASIW